MSASLSQKLSQAYSEWIGTYSSREFEDLAVTLERLLDRYAEDETAIAEAYGKAMELEFAFFDAFS